MIDALKNTPIDIVINILSYSGIIKYRFIFQRKREKDDTSSICLYYYKLK